MMKLYYNRPSPYGRVTLVVVHEKKLLDRVELIQADPWIDPPALIAVTPLSKVPALVTDDGVLITESMAICAYLDEVGPPPRLLGGERAPILSRLGLAQGIIDAAFITVIERRRPPELQWPDWIARQRRALERTLAVLAAPPASRFDLGDVTLACGLAYMDFRLPEIPWRSSHPGLAEWIDRVKQRPSMEATKPQP